MAEPGHRRPEWGRQEHAAQADRRSRSAYQGRDRFAGGHHPSPPTAPVKWGSPWCSRLPVTSQPMTVLENVALGALFSRAAAHRKEEQALDLAREALSFVGLVDRRQEPVGISLHEQRFLELAQPLPEGPAPRTR